MQCMQSILIVKTSAIGDVIQTFPVLHYLRARFPEAEIDWVAERSIVPLLKAHPLLSQVIPIDTRRWRKEPFSQETRLAFSQFKGQLRKKRYDVLFDLQGNAKSAVVTLCANANTKVGYSWRSVREKCNLFATNQRIYVPSDGNIRSKYLRLVQSYYGDEKPFEFHGVRLLLNEEEQKRLEATSVHVPTLMVCFGSKWQNKQLDPTSWLQFLTRLSQERPISFLFIYGDEREKAQAEEFASHFPDRSQVVGELSLPLWQALMWKVEAVLAVDSAALHLCGTTATPSFSVFGPSLSTIYKPLEERHASFQGTCPYGLTFPQRCPKLRTCKTGACIRSLNGDVLFDAFQNSSSKQRIE